MRTIISVGIKHRYHLHGLTAACRSRAPLLNQTLSFCTATRVILMSDSFSWFDFADLAQFGTSRSSGDPNPVSPRVHLHTTHMLLNRCRLTACRLRSPSTPALSAHPPTMQTQATSSWFTSPPSHAISFHPFTNPCVQVVHGVGCQDTCPRGLLTLEQVIVAPRLLNNA